MKQPSQHLNKKGSLERRLRYINVQVSQGKGQKVVSNRQKPRLKTSRTSNKKSIQFIT